MFALVKELTELPGPTGHEDAVQDWIADRWSSFAHEVRRTRVDNVLARIGGSGAGRQDASRPPPGVDESFSDGSGDRAGDGVLILDVGDH